MLDPIQERNSSLTRTECEVLDLLRRGLTNKEIAKALFRSEFTIKTHVQHMLEKTGARNRTRLCLISSSNNYRHFETEKLSDADV
jgi:DNA-binding NarL/FixJ family response regulator